MTTHAASAASPDLMKPWKQQFRKLDRSRYPFRDEAISQWDRLAELYGPVEPPPADENGNYPAITVTAAWSPDGALSL